MNQRVTSGIVLRRINYQESDRIITVLTKDHGKLVLLAKGVRKAKSRLAGGIELFCTNQLTYLVGKGDIKTLVSARLERNYDEIVHDLARTQVCYEFIKLINKHIENDSGEEFYGLLESAFTFLNEADIDLDIIRIWFGLQYLALMGHSPSVDIEYDESSAQRSGKFTFDLDKMAFRPAEDGTYTVNQLKLLKLALSNEPDQLQRVKDTKELLPQILGLVQILMVNSGFTTV